MRWPRPLPAPSRGLAHTETTKTNCHKLIVALFGGRCDSVVLQISFQRLLPALPFTTMARHQCIRPSFCHYARPQGRRFSGQADPRCARYPRWDFGSGIVISESFIVVAWRHGIVKVDVEVFGDFVMVKLSRTLLPASPLRTYSSRSS